MGGMAAQIPIKGDEVANKAALDKVRADKEREVKAGHDGTWVAHPALVSVAREVFDKHMPALNQIIKKFDYDVNQSDLLQTPEGDITEGGLKQNVDVGIRYINAWLAGQGCVPLYNLMEDAATAEISRTQLWQWTKHGALLNDGRVIDRELVKQHIDEVATTDSGQLKEAAKLFTSLCFSNVLDDFLTLPAYKRITKND